MGKISFIKIRTGVIPHFGAKNYGTQAIVDFGFRLQDGYARRKRTARKRRTKVNKLIFASLLSVGAILAAQAPASQAPASQAPVTSSKPAANTAKVKKVGKKHHKKATAVNSTSVKPATK